MLEEKVGALEEAKAEVSENKNLKIRYKHDIRRY